MAAAGTPWDKLAKLPSKWKGALVAGIVAALVALYYFVFYMGVSDDMARVQSQRTQLEEEKRQYEQKRQDYLSFRNEVQRLIEEQKELLKILPRKDEIPGFLEAIHSQAELVGIDVLQFEHKGEEPKDFYAKIPVSMAVTGPYHRIAKFFRNVGELKRIVNIENLSLTREQVVKKTTAGGKPEPPLLRATFDAATFRFMDKGKGT